MFSGSGTSGNVDPVEEDTWLSLSFIEELEVQIALFVC
jgi:hypothetical protein